ncbi:MAG: TonB-dependent receptor [Bacteroidales bacterium]|nr:TonB-dependent receptor [Bacteroidales bacterium]
MRRQFFLSLFFLAISGAVLKGQNGIIEGRIYNAKNNEPVEFATIAIFGTTIGSISDLDGNFLFTGMEPGFVELRVSSVGFEEYISEAIQVTNADRVYIEIPLEEANYELDEIVVKASPFRRDKESPLSLRRINIEEIEKAPGGNRDISKVIQSYPGVASTPAQRNDVIVRGGGPNENSFYLDGIEIPNINHFATQGASGGPVGIINADFIREVNLYSAAFPSNRGNALSSIIDLYQVDGNKEKFNFKGSIGASDLALTADGPIGEKTTYVVSARRSYLQLLFSVIGLPFLPKYNDYQLKVKSRINDKNELTLVSIGSYDINSLNLTADSTDQQKYILGNLPENYQWSYAIGLVYKHFREKGYDTFVLSRNYLDNKSIKYLSNDPETDTLLLDYASDEIENKFRYENTTRFDNGLKLNLGVNYEYAKYKTSNYNLTYINGSPLEFDYYSDLYLHKWGVFGQTSREFLGKRLLLSLGFRMDANNYNKHMSNLLNQFSPRISASYMLSTGLYLNFNTGRYFQLPAYTTLGYKDENGVAVNKENNLTYIQADHFVTGIEYLPDNQSKISVEGFYKIYNNYPFSLRDSISLASKGADFGLYGNEPVTSTGEGRSYGAEFLYRNKDLFGFNLILSYTLVRSETKPLKASLLNRKWLPTAWDNRHLLNLTGTRKFKGNWQVGFKWRFVGGTPYTPIDLEASANRFNWDYTGREILDFDRYNSLYFKPFHQLDLRVDKEWFLNNLTLNLYFDIQNLYNYATEGNEFLVQQFENERAIIENPEDPLPMQRYRMDKKTTQVGTLLPSLGIIIKF